MYKKSISQVEISNSNNKYGFVNESWFIFMFGVGILIFGWELLVYMYTMIHSIYIMVLIQFYAQVKKKKINFN
jgi:hypothetical protein